MHTFDAWGLAKLLGHIDDSKESLSKLIAMGGADDTMDAQAITLYMEGVLFEAMIHAKEVKLQSTHDRVWEGGGPLWMAVKTGDLTYNQAKHELVVLRQCIEADLEKHLFAFIDPKKVDLFAAMAKEWEAVFKTIPDSKGDTEDAHIARMVELHTATVFHMMRVAEHGLRKLAVKLRIKLTHKGKTLPIEFADWEKVITGLKNKIDAIRQTKVGPTRQKQLEIYSDAADHCTFMKDIWRNNVSHARKPYKTSEALGVLERVRDFMRFVAREFA